MCRPVPRMLAVLLGVLFAASLACNLLPSSPTTAVPGPTQVPPSEVPPSQEPPSPQPVASPSDGAPPRHPDWLPYENGDCSFRVSVPPGSTVSATDAATDRVDLRFPLGTNLQEKYLQVACRPVATTCASPLAAGYEPGYLPTEPKLFNGTSFTFQTAGEGAAGSFYQWSDFSTVTGGLCLSLSFVLHSTNALNYDPPLLEYDSTAEASVFEEIMGTFQWATP